jgi:hypothetical protein
LREDVAMIAAVLETDEPTRLYSGLSLLVSAASAGRPARGLAGFGTLPLLLLDAEALAARAALPAASPSLADGPPRERFARSLVELRDLALTLPGLELWACSAALEATGTTRSEVERRLAGVCSMDAFLRQAAGAELLFV